MKYSVNKNKMTYLFLKFNSRLVLYLRNYLKNSHKNIHNCRN